MNDAAINALALLREYRSIASESAHVWMHRDGDEADFKLSYWEDKVAAIDAAIAERIGK